MSDEGQTRGSLHIVAHNASRILGGGELGTALLLRDLQERGHRVRMLCRDRPMADRIGAYGIPTGVRAIGGDLAVHDAFRFTLALRRLQPDALILTTFKKLVLAGLGARMARVPFVVQRIVLEGDDPGRGARYRWALRTLVDAIVLNADSMRPAFVGGGTDADGTAGVERPVPPDRVLTIHDGVSAPGATGPPGSVRRELGLAADAVVIGSVGRLAEQKRFDRLLRALARLPPHVHCVIAGEGAARPELETLAVKLGVADRLHLLGFRTDVGDVLGATDIYVVASDREGLSNAMLEAMVVGVPVVSTRVSGAREALAPESDEPAGLVVERSDEGLAAGLERLVADAALLNRLSANARRRARREFGRQRFLDDWERLLLDGVVRAGDAAAGGSS